MNTLYSPYFYLQLQCRITYIKPTTKLIGLSATNGIISLQSNSKADDFIGAIEECTVLRADANSGLLVKLENERKGFVHVSRKEFVKYYFSNYYLLYQIAVFY